MKRFSKEDLQSEKGFTMIELILVIAIMGVLAAALVPSVLEMTRKARFSADLNTVKYLQTQVELYMAEHDGQFPGDLNEQGEPANGVEGNTNSVLKILVGQQYLKKDDIDEKFFLDLQSRKDGASLTYNRNTDNIALGIKKTGDLETIGDNLTERDKKWVVMDSSND